MEREIKFRCWDSIKKRMSDVYWLEFSNTVWAYNEDELAYGSVNAGLIIMQATGLKDKNGRTIYSGDILATSNMNPEYDLWGKEENGYTTVMEDELGWTFSLWHPTFSGDSIYDIKFCEVIGNIYENPELIKQ